MYGTGSIVSIRDKEGLYVVQLNNWILASGVGPMMYIQGNAFKRSLPIVIDPLQKCRSFIGEVVTTPYGRGIVTGRRNDCLVVTPLTWNLANESKPTFYLQRHDVKSAFPVGTRVKTAYGTGRVSAIRSATGTYIVDVDSCWHLATGKGPVMYLGGAGLEPLTCFVGEIVHTPYGEGVVVEKRQQGFLVVRPTKWNLAYGQKATFFIHQRDTQPAYKTGDLVKTAYGTGYISQTRARDGMYIIHLNEWVLANGIRPVIFTKGSHLTLITPSKVSLLDDHWESVSEPSPVERGGTLSRSDAGEDKKGCVAF